MILSRHVPASVASSALCVVAAAAAAGSALWRALVLEPLPAARAASGLDTVVVPPRRSPPATEQVLGAIEKDPFRADRRRPATAFRLQDPRATHARTVAAPVVPAAVRVIGTAVLPQGGGFAICQRSGGSPTLVRLGGTLGDLTLKAVEPGAATFLTAAGVTLVVRVAQSGGGS